MSSVILQGNLTEQKGGNLSERYSKSPHHLQHKLVHWIFSAGEYQVFFMEMNRHIFFIQRCNDVLQVNKVPGQAINRMNMELDTLPQVFLAFFEDWPFPVFC